MDPDSKRELFCTLINTSYKLQFESGTQGVTIEEVSYLEPLYGEPDPIFGLVLDDQPGFLYRHHNMLSGNATTISVKEINTARFDDSSSRIYLLDSLLAKTLQIVTGIET